MPTPKTIVAATDFSENAMRAVRQAAWLARTWDAKLRPWHMCSTIAYGPRDLEASSQLLEAGATHAHPETIEASLRLGAAALQILRVPADDIDQLLIRPDEV
jgi:nucleotide-binding universal stress UspA family protein